MMNNAQVRPQSDPRPSPTWVRTGAWFKRGSDCALALTMMAAAAPLLALSVAAVSATSSGPPIYAQTRTGRGRRRFTIYKVRTMYHDCERLTGPRWSTADDPRVTPVGRFLRKSHLDELPQLWNVVVGDMSLVGPRPERPEIIPELEKFLPRYGERLDVRPGLTGLAQVNLPPDVDRDSVRRKLAYDLHYVERVGVWLDLRIIAATGLFLLGVPFETSGRLLAIQPRIGGVETSARARKHEPHEAEMASSGVAGRPEPT